MEKARCNTELYSNLRAPLNNVKPSNFWGSHHFGDRLFLLVVGVTTQTFRLISLRHGILDGLTSTITTSTLARYWRSLSSQVICRGRGEGVMRRKGLAMTVLGMWVMGEDCDGMEIVSVFRKVQIINIL